MDGNKLKVVWVKKDDLTSAYETEEAKRVEIERRAKELEHKARMLGLKAKEDELKTKADEIEKYEKQLARK